ncbi:MAG: glycine cleavage T C-terminal barrel domain-containing protein [Bacteroidota bacterium]
MAGSHVPEDLEREFGQTLTGSTAVDLSALGKIEITGSDRLDLIHRLSTNDLGGASPGDLRPTVFLTEKGRIIDRVLLFVADSAIVMLTSRGAAQDVLQWIDKFTITEDVASRDITSESSICCVVGSQVDSTVSRLFRIPAQQNSWQSVPLGAGEVTIGLHTNLRETIAYLITDLRNAPEMWRRVSGTGSRVQPIGAKAYEAYRINLGVPSWGHELCEKFTPLDVGLREEISFTKGCYIGQEVIARLDTYKKSHRHLAGIVFRGEDPGEAGQSLLSGGREIGVMTSAMHQPVRGQYLGLAVVDDAAASVDTRVVTSSTGAEGSFASFPMIGGSP